MRYHSALVPGLLLLVTPASVWGAGRNLTVAADGSGDFKTVQAAVNSVPADNHERIVLFIKKGTYREQVRIHTSFLTLHGEDRKRTQLVSEVDTSSCPTAPGESKEERCATVLADGSDLVFEGLTIANTYTGSGKGAALAVAGNATHIAIAHVDIIGHGGDTLVLSARRSRMGDGGEYYLNDVHVSGTYHIIVPRGTTYAVNCKFWCMGGAKSCLFNEGITRETDKLVIRDSAIDGPEPFGLGSYFRDAAWYFVGDTISSKLMPDGAIRREPALGYQMKWGEGRIYFADNTAPDYPWLRSNIESSPAKSVSAVTAAWTLSGWNPESSAPPVVVQVERNAREMRLVFSESVTVHGEPRLELESAATAAFVSGSGTDTLVFRARVRGWPRAVQLNGGAIFASGATLRRRNADVSLAHATRAGE